VGEELCAADSGQGLAPSKSMQACAYWYAISTITPEWR